MSTRILKRQDAFRNISVHENIPDFAETESLMYDADPFDMVPTPLFNAVESKNWKTVIMFAMTGTTNLFHFKSSEGDNASLETQASTWVTSLGPSGEQLRRLPLHVALEQAAPLDVVQCLLALYPNAVLDADQDGNLPLHLAFRCKSSVDVVLELIKRHPESVHAKDKGGNLFYEETSTNQSIETAYRDGCTIVSDQSDDTHKELIKRVLDNSAERKRQETAGLNTKLEEESKKVIVALYRLLEAKEELNSLKKQAYNDNQKRQVKPKHTFWLWSRNSRNKNTIQTTPEIPFERESSRSYQKKKEAILMELKDERQRLRQLQQLRVQYN